MPAAAARSANAVAHWPQAAPTFTIYDESHVLVDLPHTPVIVNDPDEKKREARLNLLARIRGAVHRVADFSRIEG